MIFQEHTQEFSGSFDAIALAVEPSLKKQKEDIEIADREEGVFVTKATSHGLFSTLDRYWVMVVDKQGDDSARISFKIMTFSAGEYVGNNRFKLVPETGARVMESKVNKFLRNIKNSLEGKK